MCLCFTFAHVKLDELKAGQHAVVKSVGGSGALRQHLLDMGIIPGSEVKMLGAAPMGDPVKILIHSYSLSLRLSEAALVELEDGTNAVEVKGGSRNEPDDDDFARTVYLHEHNSHPGYGEEGRYHRHEDDANALPEDTELTFVLAGQQNCGKTTLFNRLTGSNQHVGNFPGVTVDRKEGVIKGYPRTKIIDLPGIYSLSPYTPEEKVSRECILQDKPQCIINIVDAGNLERNLYLTLQLMKLGVPVVLALNMIDELRGNGGSVRVNEMERILGLPVVAISAASGEGVNELVKHAVHIASYRELPLTVDFCSTGKKGAAVRRALTALASLVTDESRKAGVPAAFAAEKIAEGDRSMYNALEISAEKSVQIENILRQMENERGLDRVAAIADMRFSYIGKLCAATVVKPAVESREYKLSRRIDKVLTGKWTAMPIFVAVMALIIYLDIDVLGAPLQRLIAAGISYLGERTNELMLSSGVSEALRSLVTDGIFGGVGSVVSFVPIIVILFFFLSLLEDSGYMARVAFVSDKMLRKIGLSGRSIAPLLIGFGCSVPAVMATRTLPSATDRKLTILLTPFMSCSAKLPIYAFFVAAFFPGKGAIVLACLYLFSIFVGVMVALVRKWAHSGVETSPFVMELPNYRLPRLSNVGHLLWDKTKDFLQRAFTVIFLATIVVWVLQSFDWQFNMVQNGEESMLACIAGWIAPVFAPLGLGDWRIVTSLITGFIAKESVVSTMEVLGVLGSFTLATAISMLVFCLLYTPCVAAVASVRRELGGKWALFVVVFQCFVAWVLAFVAYRVVLFFI